MEIGSEKRDQEKIACDYSVKEEEDAEERNKQETFFKKRDEKLHVKVLDKL